MKKLFSVLRFVGLVVTLIAALAWIVWCGTSQQMAAKKSPFYENKAMP